MAVDESLLNSLAVGGPPTIRFYAWQPECFSIGRFQHAANLATDTRRQPGVRWVRRPTGGRALLHGPEVTYSVTAPLDDPLVGGSVLESYRRIALALLNGISRLGVSATLAPEADGASLLQSPSCFSSPSDYELLVGGRKLIGSAQMRRRHGFLQHGSLLLQDSAGRFFEGLAFDCQADRAAAYEHSRSRTVSLSDVLGRAPARSEVEDVLLEGFRAELGIDPEVGDLSGPESDDAQRLCEGKYRSEEWSYRY